MASDLETGDLGDKGDAEAVAADDAVDGRIEFVFSAGTDVPPVASGSFRKPEDAPQL